MAAAMEQTRSSSDLEEEYEVEKIVGMCESKGETLYKVRWLNYSPSWDTWEPYGNLESCREMMMEYRKKHEKQLAKQKDKKICENEEERESVVEVSGTTRKPKQKKHTFVYVSSDEEEANTLKDRFWHDLEQGKINILDGSDLYSKVKSQGRSARPQSFENMFKDLRRGASCNGDHVKVHMKRNAPASSGKKSGRPQKASKNHDTGGKKVMAKTNNNAVVAKRNSENKSPHAADSDSRDKVDTIKDSFWRDLEDGKINVFGSDLYSKVKGSGRSARPKSFQNMFKIRQPRATKECKESKHVSESRVLPMAMESQTRGSQSPITDTQCGNVAADEHMVDEETSPASSQLTHQSSADVIAKYYVSPPADILEQCKTSSCNNQKHGLGCIDSEVSVSSSDPNVSVSCIDPEVSVGSSDPNVSVRCVGSEVSVSNSDENNTPLWCHVKPVNNDLSTSEMTVGVKASVLQTTPELSSAEPTNNYVSSAEPVTYDASLVSLSFSVVSKSTAATSSGYSCPNVPLVEANLTSNELAYSDQHTVAASTHSNITNLTACSREPSMHTTMGIVRSCTSSGQIKQISGMSASLTSLIHLNSQPMENELNCGAVSGDTPESVSSSRSRLPVIADSISTALSADYAKMATYPVDTSMSMSPLMEEDPRSRKCSVENPMSKMPLMEGSKSHTVHVECPRSKVENSRSGVPLMEYSVPNISSKLSTSSIEHSKLQMRFEECPESRSSLVDWDVDVGSSVFQVNGAVNVAPSSQMSPTSRGLREHEMSFTSMVDYSQNARMDNSRHMLTDTVLLPLGNQLCVDSVVPPMQYYHPASSPNKFHVEQTCRTLENPGAMMPPMAIAFNSHGEAALRTAPTNPPLVEHTREMVGNSRSKPITGHSRDMSSNPVGRVSSMEQKVGIDHLQHHIDGGAYASSEMLQDIDDRFLMNIHGGLRQEYTPRKQAVKAEKQEEDDLLQVDFNIEPISASLKASKKKSVRSITELTNADILHAVETNDYDTVEWALQTGVFDLNQRNTAGLTLTMIAARNGYDNILEVLVRRGANVNAITKTGASALIIATEMSVRCTVELLLLLGAHMNIRTETLETALIKAIKLGHKNIVKLLLDYGANFGCPQNDNMTALDYAMACKSTDCLDVLNRHIARLTAEFENQMLVTLNKTAKIMSFIFPMQCFALCEGHKFKVLFQHELQPTRTGAGMLLFIAHTQLTLSTVQCRFYGASAVTSVTLNGVTLHAVTKESNFVMSFSPLQDRVNELVIHTAHTPTSKGEEDICNSGERSSC